MLDGWYSALVQVVRMSAPCEIATDILHALLVPANTE